jgi:ubiquinone/menaquinone biosynthesis C-methylase UbiE
MRIKRERDKALLPSKEARKLTPDKDEIARRFGQASAAYASSPGHAYGADLRLLIELIRPQPHMTAIDIATGAGHTAAALAPLVKSVIATDLSRAMIGETERLLKARAITNCKVALMDGESLEFPDATFDLATCRIAAHHFLNPTKATKEIARVLKSGGVFGLEDSCSPADSELDRFINNVEVLRDKTHVRAYTELQWQAMLEAAGFKLAATKYYRKSHDVEEWLSRLSSTSQDKEAVHDAFRTASESARKYFEIKFENGRADCYTDDKILIRAEKY